MHPAKSLLLGDEEKAGVMALWNAEYPEKLRITPHEFDDYLSKQQNTVHYLLLDRTLSIKAWAMAFTRENERWFAMIIDSSEQRKGYGTGLLEELKKDEAVLNAWVIDHGNDKKSNGDPYLSPLPFYLKNGFWQMAKRLETDKLSATHIRWSK